MIPPAFYPCKCLSLKSNVHTFLQFSAVNTPLSANCFSHISFHGIGADFLEAENQPVDVTLGRQFKMAAQMTIFELQQYPFTTKTVKPARNIEKSLFQQCTTFQFLTNVSTE